jgi:hypothetical protein
MVATPSATYGYSNEYFETFMQRSLHSARAVVAIVVDMVHPDSVVDVGCGQAPWLAAFQENGVKVVHGMDGSYVDRSRLFIDPSCFEAVDLGHPFTIRGRYDLAVCLEVVEHLADKAGKAVVKALAGAAPVVLFSAAIPGQGGEGHVNERLPAYWEVEFNKQGFRRLDAIRPRIWNDPRVDLWYRQNLFLFASGDVIERNQALQAEASREAHPRLECVEERLLATLVSRSSCFSAALRALPGLAWKAVKRRLQRNR